MIGIIRKPTAALALILLGLFGCQQGGIFPAKSNTPTVAYQKVPFGGAGFKPNESIETTTYSSIRGIPRASSRNVGFLNGIAYLYSQNKGSYYGVVSSRLGKLSKQISASSGDWYIKCDQDKMTDKKSCFILLHIHTIHGRKAAIVFSFPTHEGPNLISVGINHYPGSEIQLRVDQNKPHFTPANKGFYEFPLSLMLEISHGSKVVTRYKERPHDTWIEMEFNTTGFPLAIELMAFLYNK